MDINRALKIFFDILSDEYTVYEKGLAIHKVIEMPTHNGIRKYEILRALNWLLHEHYEFKDENREQGQKERKSDDVDGFGQEGAG